MELPSIDMYNGSSMIWASQAAFMLSAHLMERTSRSLYLNTRALSERNREIERDLLIARMIMDNLLPKNVTTIPGVRAGSLYIPMDKVGGDFFDLRADGGIIKLFIADVSGHGLASSYLALITKLSLDKIDPAQTPARALDELNDFICASTVKSNYVTAFLGAISIDSGKFTYASAGHPPAILHRASTGEILEHRTRGKALGWFPGGGFREDSVSLLQGDRLVLYTDGVTECMDPNGTMFGDERFHHCIRSGKSLSPDELAEKIIGELRIFSRRNTFDDDITLLVVDMI
jgi:sigma-B regulation protein RsbU (phosphoserine phosphatase)